MSVTFIIGLDGVSTQTNRALCSADRGGTARRSDMSTTVWPMPQAPSTRLISR